MSFKQSVILCIISVTLSSVSAYKYLNCTGEPATISNVKVNCSGSDPVQCILKKGHSYDFNVYFVADVTSSNLKAEVFGLIAGKEIPFPLSNDNGCKNSGIACPVAKGKPYHYRSSINVLKLYPSIKLNVIWKLVDTAANGQNTNEFCLVIPVQIE